MNRQGYAPRHDGTLVTPPACPCVQGPPSPRPPPSQALGRAGRWTRVSARAPFSVQLAQLPTGDPVPEVLAAFGVPQPARGWRLRLPRWRSELGPGAPFRWSPPALPRGASTLFAPPRSIGAWEGYWARQGPGGQLAPLRHLGSFGRPPEWRAPVWMRHAFNHAASPAFQAMEPDRVDIYFSAGIRENWDTLAADIPTAAPRRDVVPGDGYRSCDDGNDRNCSIWRVRWETGVPLWYSRAQAEPIRTRESYGLSQGEPLGLTRPAVSPAGRLAYSYRHWAVDHAFGETTEAYHVMVGAPDGDAAEDYPVTVPMAWGYPSGSKGGTDWPSFLVRGLGLGDDTQLLTGSEFTLGYGEGYYDSAGDPQSWEADDASFKTVRIGPLERVVWSGKHEVDSSRSLRGVGAFYDAVGRSAPDPALSQWLMGVGFRGLSDPFGHPQVQYGGAVRGARVAAFGETHDASTAGSAQTVVFDPDVDDPLGLLNEAVEAPPEVGAGGLHHPTFSPTGAMLQCSHMQGEVAVGGPSVSKFVGRRTLHGFTAGAEGGPWTPWDGAEGRLFPTDVNRFYRNLPDSVESSSAGLAGNLPDPVPKAKGDSTDEQCLIYDWNYGAFCGSDDWVVAKFACENAEWIQAKFQDELNSIEPGVDYATRSTDLGHLAQLASRVVLIRRSDGFHHDLTSLVEKALFGEAATGWRSVERGQEAMVFGLYPTCATSSPGAPSWAGGTTLFRPAEAAW